MPSAEIDRYVLHLNHALAMEAALVDHLARRAAEIDDPDIKERFEHHRQETVEHKQTVRRRIEALQADLVPSQARVQPPIVSGVPSSSSSSPAEDKKLMEAMADYAVESYEAAVYAALAQIARSVGHADDAPDFDRIRRQEISMASFLAECQPALVRAAFPSAARAA